MFGLDPVKVIQKGPSGDVRLNETAAPLRNSGCPPGPPTGFVACQELTESTRTPGISRTAGMARSR